MASFQTPPRKALELYARTLASGLNGGGRMASARKMELCNRPLCAERKALWRDSDTVAVAGIDVISKHSLCFFS